MCDMAAALSSSSSYTSSTWKCNANGIPVVSVCGTSTSPSPWTGVTCSGVNGVVTSINTFNRSIRFNSHNYRKSYIIDIS